MSFETLSSAELTAALSVPPSSETVASFQPSEHIQRTGLTVDVDRLRVEAERFLRSDDEQGEGFHTRSITRRPGATSETQADLSGRYWTRPDGTYEEVPRDDIVDESAYSELVPDFEGSYIAAVLEQLRQLAPIGRVRLLGKDPFNCNSWHRDPEPRFHIPIVTNPGSLFVINHHVTHLPADGSVYFTDTRAYHTALNGGEQRRVSIVAAIAISPNAS